MSPPDSKAACTKQTLEREELGPWQRDADYGKTGVMCPPLCTKTVSPLGAPGVGRLLV